VLEQCDSGSSGSSGIVGGGKRTKTQSPKSTTKSVVARSRQQSAGMISKQKFYGEDQLTRPPLATHSRRRPPPISHCKPSFFSHLPMSRFLMLLFLLGPYEMRLTFVFLSFFVFEENLKRIAGFS